MVCGFSPLGRLTMGGRSSVIATNSTTGVDESKPDGWSPPGYSSPKIYTSDERWGLGIATLLIPPVVVLIKQPLTSGTMVLTGWAEALGQSGLSNPPFVYIALVLCGLCGWIIGSSVVIIVVHEGIHYATACFRGLNPSFEWTSFYGVLSPSVVAYAQGIQRWENILMLAAPFFCLSLICGGLMWMTEGLVSATAAIMFAVNAVPSGMDLYNVGRLVNLPRGTIFANLETEDGLRTEYAVRASRN